MQELGSNTLVFSFSFKFPLFSNSNLRRSAQIHTASRNQILQTSEEKVVPPHLQNNSANLALHPSAIPGTLYLVWLPDNFRRLHFTPTLLIEQNFLPKLIRWNIFVVLEFLCKQKNVNSTIQDFAHLLAHQFYAVTRFHISIDWHIQRLQTFQQSMILLCNAFREFWVS